MNTEENTLSIHFEQDDFDLTTEHIQSLFDIIAEGEKISPTQLVDVIFCSEETIQRLNKDYREKDSITDVLSFPFNEDDYLGEIYICVPRALEQAREYNLTIEEESARLFTHGLFHLLGFDHIEDEQRLLMEAKEKTYFTVE